MFAMRLVFRAIPVLLCLTLALAACNGESVRGATTAADTIFTGGTVLTIEPAGEAEALAVRDGLIAGVGSEKEVMALKGPSTRVIDLHGKTLMPGFVEAHIHYFLMALSKFMVPVGSEDPGGLAVDEVKRKIAQAVPDVPPGLPEHWLLAWGFDPARTIPLFAELKVGDLDAISTTVPIMVLNANFHIGYVNHKAYELAGVTNDTPNPPGGTFVKDSNGHLNGQLWEQPAFDPFLKKVLQPSQKDMLQSLKEVAQEGLSNKGITTVGDINTGTVLGFDKELALLRRLAPTSPVRTRLYPSWYRVKDLPSIPAPFSGDDKLDFVGVKFTLDGSCQGFTCAVTKPYLRRPEDRGKPPITGELNFKTSEVIAAARPYAEQGWQITLHSNGDRALDQALEIYEALLADTPNPSTRRYRIEHYTMTRESQVRRTAQLGLTPSMNIGHLFFWGAVFKDHIIGERRARRLDPTGDCKKFGVRFSLHSDAIVTSVNPLRYLSNAVLRLPQPVPPNFEQRPPLGPEQRITIDDALRAVTLDAAWQMFFEDKVGSLEVGKYADVIVLEQNPRSADPSRLESIKITDVYLAGVRQGP